MEAKAYAVSNSGAILKFAMDCLDVPKETQDYSYQHLKRLAEGKGLSKELREQTIRSVVDAIVGAFSGEMERRGTAARVFEEVQTDPLKYVTWRFSPEGEFRDLGDHLVADLLEFLKRHEALVEQFGAGDAGPEMLWVWGMRFVVPLLAMNDMEYRNNYSGLFRGMPPGRLWYLPALTCPQAEPWRAERERLKRGENSPRCPEVAPGMPDLSSKDLAVRLPVHAVLEWWQDLLGDSLESLAGKLCAFDEDRKLVTARREVWAWLHEDRPPAARTINRWCSQKWEYKGALEMPPALSVSEKLGWCREFLNRKGLDCEALKREIWCLPGVSLEAFFAASDPIGDGLPVDELVRRVVERYSPPTPEQLKVRLLWAGAFQRAFRATKKALGADRAWKLVGFYRKIGRGLIEVMNHCKKPTRGAILELVSELPPEKGFLREALIPLLSPDERWREMMCSAIASDWLKTRVSGGPGGE